jgi:hypothetical protein
VCAGHLGDYELALAGTNVARCIPQLHGPTLSESPVSTPAEWISPFRSSLTITPRLSIAELTPLPASDINVTASFLNSGDNVAARRASGLSAEWTSSCKVGTPSPFRDRPSSLYPLTIHGSVGPAAAANPRSTAFQPAICARDGDPAATSPCTSAGTSPSAPRMQSALARSSTDIEAVGVHGNSPLVGSLPPPADLQENPKELQEIENTSPSMILERFAGR